VEIQVVEVDIMQQVEIHLKLRVELQVLQGVVEKDQEVHQQMEQVSLIQVAVVVEMVMVALEVQELLLLDINFNS
tara:strand:+ start:469 stop:693 length:225 start_codon:yes stop_codon:yes gene_type:complete